MRSTPKANVDAPAGGPGPAVPALVEPGVRAAPRRERAGDAAQDWVDLERRLAMDAGRQSKRDVLSGAEAKALAEAAAQGRMANAAAEPAPEAGAVRARRESRDHASVRRLRRLSKVLALVLTAFVLGFAVSRVSMRLESRPGERGARLGAPASELKLDRNASSFANRVQSPAREPAPVAGGQ